MIKDFMRVPQAEVQIDQARKQLITDLTRLVLNHPDKKRSMDQLLISSNEAYKPSSARAKETIENQRTSEAFELLWAFIQSAIRALCEVHGPQDACALNAENEYHRRTKIPHFQDQVNRLTKLQY